MIKRMDITGEVYGFLTVLGEGPRNGCGKRQWLCRCECGIQKVVNHSHLRGGRIVSCGYHQRRQLATNNLIHGMEGTCEYSTWVGMIQRCHNPRNNSYGYYGGRGIRVCPEWRASFPAFYAYMGRRPGPGYSIDRINVDGNYEPGNCRWATASIQARNKRPCVRRPPFATGGQLRLPFDPPGPSAR